MVVRGGGVVVGILREHWGVLGGTRVARDYQDYPP